MFADPSGQLTCGGPEPPGIAQAVSCPWTRGQTLQPHPQPTEAPLSIISKRTAAWLKTVTRLSLTTARTWVNASVSRSSPRLIETTSGLPGPNSPATRLTSRSRSLKKLTSISIGGAVESSSTALTTNIPPGPIVTRADLISWDVGVVWAPPGRVPRSDSSATTPTATVRRLMTAPPF